MTVTVGGSETDPRQTIAELRQEIDRRTAELSEARDQQAAVGDVLKVISHSSFDLQPVPRRRGVPRWRRHRLLGRLPGLPRIPPDHRGPRLDYRPGGDGTADN